MFDRRHLGPAHLLRILAVILCVDQVIGAPPLVVETQPLTPAEQRAEFELPPGFQIELVASEPDIGQPMNLNFDSAGRLWVTHSVEYPYPVAGEGVEPRDERFGPAGEGPPRDRLSVISGIGTDRTTITHFADGLNIPIGIVPLSPTRVVGYSIPNIAQWSDVDGDGRADQSGQVLYGPFGNVDTHGMVNGLTYWIDGWIYACHGFRNTSTIAGADGHEITMNSGNTFRFKPDGSRMEQFTWGEVNPFGLTFDRWGHIYTADCHSKPLTCLIPGSSYPSFGKPHDGLGFGPDMIDHAHGSTGICGPCYYAADQFPSDYCDNMYLCNPVTGRVHRDKLIWHGSSPHVDTQPDFITCDDGWFRPVDIQLGPDGALYIADFYNAIIGHYEVPLEHPNRDRTHGRIWRVTYAGDERADQTTTLPDLTSETLDQLIERLGDPNLTRAVLASHEIEDRFAQSAVDSLRQALVNETLAEQRIQILWLMNRLGALTQDDCRSAADDESALVRTHTARILGSRESWGRPEAMLATNLLQDDDPRVRRAAAEVWAGHPDESIIEPLIRNLPSADDADTHLRHTMRIALRNCLQQPGVLASRTQSLKSSEEVASICLAIPTNDAAHFLLNVMMRRAKDAAPAAWITHIAQYSDDDDVSRLIGLLRDETPGDLTKQLAAMRAVEAGQSRRSEPRNADFTHWVTAVTRDLLGQIPAQTPTWQSVSEPTANGPLATWGITVRKATDGRPTRLWTSLPGGEQGVGIYRSPTFELSQTLQFWIAGHDGLPQEEAAGKNLVRLVHEQSGELLRSVPPPRQDSPVEVVWEFEEHIGEPVRFELIDGLSLNAYAWIAAGRFSIDSLNPPAYVPSELAAELIGTLELADLRPDVEALINNADIPAAAVSDLAAAHLQLNPDVRLQAMLPWIDADPPTTLGAAVRKQVVAREKKRIDELLTQAMRTASSNRQQLMAEELAGSRDGAQRLVELVTAGHASPRLLRAAAVVQKLTAVVDDSLQRRIEELVRSLPPANEQLAALIQERKSGFDREAASAEQGREIFKKSCAICHQIGDEGKKVGPQLDGVGIRGLDRLLEDILDPNRNVDAAFRSTTLLTDDGRVLTGLLRQEEGAILVLADAKGEEFRVPVSEIDERALSSLSLMPEDIAAKLPATELHSLLAYLLDQMQKNEK